MMRWIVGMGLLAASVTGGPARAGTDVHIGINFGLPSPPGVVIEAPPQLVVVPHTPVYYAPELPYDVFTYAGHYYSFQANAWYWAAGYEGPWYPIGIGRVPRPVLAVPVTYYKTGHRHWSRHGRPPWDEHEHREHHHHHHDDEPSRDHH